MLAEVIITAVIITCRTGRKTRCIIEALVITYCIVGIAGHPSFGISHSHSHVGAVSANNELFLTAHVIKKLAKFRFSWQMPARRTDPLNAHWICAGSGKAVHRCRPVVKITVC